MLSIINSRHPDPVLPDLDWLRSTFIPTMKCPECNRVDRSHFPSPLNVCLERDPGVDGSRLTGHISRTSITIYHLALIEQLRPYLSDYVLGTCRLQSGKVIDQYVTCYKKDFTIFRGNKIANYYTCKSCPLISLNTAGQRRQYVLRKDLTDARVYQNASTWLYLDKELAAGIDWSAWPDAELYDVEVIDKPFDKYRLPGDPDWSVK